MLYHHSKFNTKTNATPILYPPMLYVLLNLSNQPFDIFLKKNFFTLLGTFANCIKKNHVWLWRFPYTSHLPKPYPYCVPTKKIETQTQI
jgi:hypothetical protein